VRIDAEATFWGLAHWACCTIELLGLAECVWQHHEESYVIAVLRKTLKHAASEHFLFPLERRERRVHIVILYLPRDIQRFTNFADTNK
jgi:hypothetical protein